MPAASEPPDFIPDARRPIYDTQHVPKRSKKQSNEAGDDWIKEPTEDFAFSVPARTRIGVLGRAGTDEARRQGIEKVRDFGERERLH